MKSYKLVLEDTSPSEMDRFREWMFQILLETKERKKNLAEMEKQVLASQKSKTIPVAKAKVNKTVDEVIKPKSKVKTINNRGFIVAENGIRLHGTPSPYDTNYVNKKGNASTVYTPKTGLPVTVLHEELDNKGWYNIKMYDNKTGFIEKHNIDMLPYNSYLDKYTHAYHYVRTGQNFENHIAKTYLGHIPLKTGFDRRNLAQAFFLLNSQSKHNHGIVINNKSISSTDLLETALKMQADPSFHGVRLNYKAMQLKQRHVVRVPNYKYIMLQQKLGTISSRSQFANNAIDAGDAAAEILKGMAGLLAGIVEGVVMGIYDILVGIIDSIQQIIETLYDLFTGALFEKLKAMYNSIVTTIKNMSAEEIKKAFIGILGKAGEQIIKTINNWKKASSFEKGRVIGLVLGTLLLEVLLAIFTGGSANVAKWGAKLGKLGKVMMEIADLSKDIKAKLKAKLPKKYFQKGAYEKDPDDTKNWQRWALLAYGKTLSETLDANGSTINKLMLKLNTTNIYPKLKRKWNKTHKGGNVYAVTLTASPTKIVDAHFTSGEKDKNDIFADKNKYSKEFYNGPKPKYENPGHHDKKSPNFRGGGGKTEIIPDNAEELYKKAIPGFTNELSKQGIPKKWYSIDKKGIIHQFTVDNNGKTHWAGSESGSRGIHIDAKTKKRLLEYYKDIIKK